MLVGGVGATHRVGQHQESSDRPLHRDAVGVFEGRLDLRLQGDQIVDRLVEEVVRDLVEALLPEDVLEGLVLPHAHPPHHLHHLGHVLEGGAERRKGSNVLLLEPRVGHCQVLGGALLDLLLLVLERRDPVLHNLVKLDEEFLGRRRAQDLRESVLHRLVAAAEHRDGEHECRHDCVLLLRPHARHDQIDAAQGRDQFLHLDEFDGAGVFVRGGVVPQHPLVLLFAELRRPPLPVRLEVQNRPYHLKAVELDETVAFVLFQLPDELSQRLEVVVAERGARSEHHRHILDRPDHGFPLFGVDSEKFVRNMELEVPPPVCELHLFRLFSRLLLLLVLSECQRDPLHAAVCHRCQHLDDEHGVFDPLAALDLVVEKRDRLPKL
mmetsp:Transcript_10303/g.22988  ORF Transcript_10303/g.22988 Transcript_10303/m.22988 type:complete len:380 (-) Transcript_10303:4148-5287(-)